MSDTSGIRDRDEQKLAELGYKQELARAWSGFSNFAISFTIISVLAGCFTTYGQAWNNGGPIAISWAWPIIGAIILVIALCMSELVSAYPTAGGPYWWAAKLGGPAWAWFTGWFNVIGLIAVVASVDYAAANFASSLFNLWSLDFIINFADGVTLGEVFVVFVLLLALHAVLNIFSSHLVALFNGISVWWHVLGVLAIIGILSFVPDHHQSATFVFTERINNTGFHGGAISGPFFWLYILPIGFILTMYTQTGYDASAHTAEETRGAALGAAKGVWKSVFYSAIAGWFVLLAFLFAAKDVKAVNGAGGTAISIFTSAMNNHMWAAKMVVLIATIGQLFCGAAGLTSASRTWYAFSRDRGMPGWWLFRRLNRQRVPLYAVMAVSTASLIITIPAVWGNALGVPFAYFAITSICTVGLYLAYIIPVYLRFRAGTSFDPGPWTLGRHYRWINVGAMAFVVLVVLSLDIPIVPAGIPWNNAFDWTAVNYSPLVLVVGVLVGIWWLLDAKNKYKGPVRTIDEAPMEIPGEQPKAGPAPTPAA